VYGKNLKVEYRQGGIDSYAVLAAELVSLDVALIIAQSDGPTRAAMNATNSIPIVMVYVSDAVGSGLVSSLARPGGNVTGVSILGPEVAAKQLELLRELDPAMTRLAVLWHPAVPSAARAFSRLQEAAETLGVELVSVEEDVATRVQSALESFGPQPADGVLVMPLAVYGSPVARRAILHFIALHRLPSVVPFREWVADGGMMSYNPKLTESLERAAVYVDRILRGARPSDLPVEQPTEFDFVLNNTTARTLGLTIPHDVAVQVTEWIQ
jgi:putative ABC transport system substrate-binding protein